MEPEGPKTMFVNAILWTLPLSSSIQPAYSNLIFTCSIILSSYVSNSLPWGFPTNIL